MILTVTLNPSIDISYPLDELITLDTVNRVSEVKKTAGGKDLNLTRVLSEIGDNVTATGFIDGKFGDFLTSRLDQNGIQHRFFPIHGETRNCIAILHEGLQTEVLEAGPMIDRDEADGFLNHFRYLCPSYDVITISGSLPAGLENDYYQKVIGLANSQGKKVVLDCSGKALEAVLTSDDKPFVIKPHTEELLQLVGREVTGDVDELKEILQDDLFAGIDWVVVSLGSKGAFAKHGDYYYRVTIPKIDVVNPVGSGDSTVAGIASAIIHNLSDKDFLRHANAGLLLAYEKTGYDATTTSRLPDCLVEWSAKRLKEEGADAVKFLLYYDVDGDEYDNLQKQAYIERIGAECKAEDMPFFLEILTYDENITDNTSAAFAKVKPHKVNEAMKVFSDDRFGIDVLKVEVPVNMKYAEGFSDGEVVYTKEEAAKAFKDQEASSHLPYILS